MATNKKSKTGQFHWDEMSLGFIPYQKPSSDLIQNCDLPPPLKTISGPDFAVQSLQNKLFGNLTGQEGEECKSCISRTEPEREKTEVLNALRLSQTRARDAERKAALLSKEKECISVMFIEESLQLMAYKKWLKILELEASASKRQKKKKKQTETKLEDDEKFTLLVGIAFCLGAGMGYAFRWVYIA